MCNRVLPNFREWADHLLDRVEVAEALEQAYQQGWYAGYHDGTEHGWSDILEEDKDWQKENQG